MGILTKRLNEENYLRSNGRAMFNKGVYGLSYQEIFNKMLQILTYDKIMSSASNTAARMLYVAYGIEVNNKTFGMMSIGGIEAYIVDQKMGDKYDHYPFDVAMIDNQPIMFIFRDCMMNEFIPKSIRISNIYTTFDALVGIMNSTGLACAPYSIYNLIASYAPYVLTVKFLLDAAIGFDMDDILYAAPESDKDIINDATFDLVRKLSLDDLLVYGALCEYIG